jgi:hypothetical protein
MKKTRLLQALVIVSGLVFSCGYASAQQATIALTGDMVSSVTAFLNGLSAEQRTTASYGFDDQERLNWHFIPRSRNGLSINDMSDSQRELARQVMSTFLSARGYQKVGQIRSLESVLAEIEVNGRFVRDPDAYFFTVFGEPSLNGTWAFRFEGHHIALNWTFVEGSGIASSPQFFGSNPAEVRSGPRAGLRVLAAEEDLARQLAVSLDASQRDQAMLSVDVPGDIFTAAEDEVAPLESTGIAYGNLNSAQQLNLMNLIEEVANAQPDAVTAARMAQVRSGRDAIRFTWIGGTGNADAHYWRVQGSDFLIEYDKTQNDANHIHLVWRDFDGDFGRDLIRLHYDAVAARFGPGHSH